MLYKYRLCVVAENLKFIYWRIWENVDHLLTNKIDNCIKYKVKCKTNLRPIFFLYLETGVQSSLRLHNFWNRYRYLKHTTTPLYDYLTMYKVMQTTPNHICINIYKRGKGHKELLIIVTSISNTTSFELIHKSLSIYTHRFHSQDKP